MHPRYMLLCAIALCLLPLCSMAADSIAPISFTKNLGQWPDSILFRASTGGTTMWITPDGVYYEVVRGTMSHSRQSGKPNLSTIGSSDSLQITLVKAQFSGANPHAQVVGLDEQTYKCNYFLGNDPSKWRSNVPTFSAVSFENIYPGVTATFRGDGGKLSYELHGSSVALTQVHTTYHGSGDISFRGMLPTADIAEAAGPTAVANVSVSYSTYLGGADNDYLSDIAVDSIGNAYVSGLTYSVDFPTHSPYQSYQGQDGFSDAVVTKLSPTGTPVYSTYVGGAKDDVSWSIAIDNQGCAYITGKTMSTDFPTRTPYQPANAGYMDVFVTKLTPAGDSLVFSTYVGGTDTDEAFGIALDKLKDVYLTGHTYSTNYPTKTPIQTEPGDGAMDVFVTKLAALGDSLIYSTYIGGNNYDDGYAIAVDDSGYAYVAGSTGSTNYPIKRPVQTDQGAGDAFVTKLAIKGDSLIFSTYLGGSNYDDGYGIAVDKAYSAYVTGSTLSPNFPTRTPYQVNVNGAFVTKLTPAGDSLAYSTYLGTASQGKDIAIDAAGNAYVTGSTSSSTFPTESPYQTDQGYDDVFVTRLAPTGNAIASSTYLGGFDNDYGRGIALDRLNNVYVTGYTASFDFPTVTPYQTYQGIGLHFDGFVAKLELRCCIGTRGNTNMRGIIDLSDVSLLIAYLTKVDLPPLPCPEAANVNAVGIVDLSDLSWLINYLTVSPQITLPNCP